MGSGCSLLTFLLETVDSQNKYVNWRNMWNGKIISTKIIIVQLLLQFRSLHLTGNHPQEDLLTRGPAIFNLIWDHWTLDLPMRGGRQPPENTSVRLWPWLCSRRVCHEERELISQNCTYIRGTCYNITYTVKSEWYPVVSAFSNPQTDSTTAYSTWQECNYGAYKLFCYWTTNRVSHTSVCSSWCKYCNNY